MSWEIRVQVAVSYLHLLDLPYEKAVVVESFYKVDNLKKWANAMIDRLIREANKYGAEERIAPSGVTKAEFEELKRRGLLVTPEETELDYPWGL